MALVGNLRDFALADFLYLIDRGYKTGSLQLNRQTEAAMLYFDKGKLLYASRTERSERLGEMLLRTGKITSQQIAHAVQLQENNSGHSIGALLMEQGYISR